MEDIQFQNITESHLEDIAEILNHYVLHSTATFHKETLSPEDMREKVFFANPIYRSLLITQRGNTIGYCAVSLWKKQEAYRHTAEINIYLKPEFTAKGIGSLAIDTLEGIAKANDIQKLIAGACSENTASISLFEKKRYVKCAHFQGVGQKFGRTLDVVYLQKSLS